MRIKSQVARTPAMGLFIVLLYLLGAVPALSLTAKDVTEKMSKDERSGYLAGLIDMRALVAAQAGDAALPKCIHDAYYGAATRSDAWSKVYDAFEQFPEKEATLIVFLLVRKTCGG